VLFVDGVAVDLGALALRGPWPGEQMTGGRVIQQV